MIAIITTNKQEFTQYLELNNLNEAQCKQVRILNDVQIDKKTPIIFSDKEDLDEIHHNVTQYVRDRIVVVSDGKITDVATTNEVGEYV